MCDPRHSRHTIPKIYRNKNKGKHDPSTQVCAKTLVGYLDLTDAFCRVPHRVLLDRLAAFEAAVYLICFVHFWLLGRSASTYVDGRYAPPQDSVLGPILFSAFIATIVASTHQRIQRRLAQPAAACAVIVAHVDDVAILVGGLRPDRMVYTRSTDPVQHVDTSCVDNDVELSKSLCFSGRAAPGIEARPQSTATATRSLPPPCAETPPRGHREANASPRQRKTAPHVVGEPCGVLHREGYHAPLRRHTGRPYAATRRTRHQQAPCAPSTSHPPAPIREAPSPTCRTHPCARHRAGRRLRPPSPPP